MSSNQIIEPTPGSPGALGLHWLDSRPLVVVVVVAVAVAAPPPIVRSRGHSRPIRPAVVVVVVGPLTDLDVRTGPEFLLRATADLP